MILMYHKVNVESKTVWWVDCNNFYRQMAEIAGKKVVYLEDYDPENPAHVVITFDGVYQNVVEYASPILEYFGYPFELFVTGNYIGKGNEFDSSEPYAKFTDLEGLKHLLSIGGRIQWHTASHVDMGQMIEPASIAIELSIPSELKKLDKHGFGWFAYPNGNFCETVVTCVREQFSGALSCNQGNNSDRYILNRLTVTNETKLSVRTISIVIPCYNYGAFLGEAIESVLRQTIPVDEIIIADDFSTDITHEIADFYVQQYPKLIHYFCNERNLGAVGNFNKAVTYASGEYICILGADNRMQSNYVEKSSIVLDRNPSVGVAYTDYALFGPRAGIVYANYKPSLQNGFKENYFLIEFPEFHDIDINFLERQNIMHGSSMFRKRAFVSVGGYREEGSTPEDHNLFLRMLKHGWTAQKVHNTNLEYRQHSREQLNEKYIALNQLNFYKNKCRDLEQRYNSVTNSPLFRLVENTLHVKANIERRIMCSLKPVKNIYSAILRRL